MTIVTGAGGRYPGALCGRSMLYSLRHCSIKIWTSFTVCKISRFSSSSPILPLNDSMQPFSHGLLGSMNNGLTASLFTHALTRLAVSSGPFSDRTRSKQLPTSGENRNELILLAESTSALLQWIRIAGHSCGSWRSNNRRCSC